jgi:hypothetical protein
MDGVEWRLAKQMADVLRTRISETEAILGLLRRLLAELESRSRCNSDVEFHDWDGWLTRFPVTTRDLATR